MKSRLQKTHIVRLKPNTGQTDVSVTFQLNGFVSSMCAYTRGTENQLMLLETVKPLIFMQLQDDSAGDIVPMVLLENYKQTTGGEYEKSFKPLNFQANNETFNLVLNTERASTGFRNNDIEVFVLFNYGTPPETVNVKPTLQPARILAVRPAQTQPRR